MRVLTIARGRPGLGHVTPGLAVSLEFARRGHSVSVAGYGAAGEFVRSFDQLRYVPIRKPPAYQDWPGLDLYDDGLRQVAPCVEENDIDLLLLAGEYLLGPLAKVCRVPTAMMFNPEIMTESDRNAMPGRLFACLFEACTHLIPIADPPPAESLLEVFRPLAERLTPSGPFTIRRSPAATPQDGVFRIVIANGGGVAFPASLESYASGEADPAAWLDQTYALTRSAVEAAMELSRKRPCSVSVFSCLPAALNERLGEGHRDSPLLRIEPVSGRYYEALEQADLVISRAGAGFVADCETAGAAAIIWPLAGHDEQLYVATNLARNRPRTFVARTAAELRAAALACGAEPDGTERSPRLREPGDRAAQLVDYLLS